MVKIVLVAGPGGPYEAAHHARLAAAGHRVVRRGKRFFVADYEQSVVEPKL